MTLRCQWVCLDACEVESGLRDVHAHARPKDSSSPLKDLSAVQEVIGRVQRIVTRALMLR